MQIIRSLESLDSDAKGCAIAIGNFDGLHLGHQAIFNKAKSEGAKAGVACAALTFDPYPREFFNPNQPSLRLMSLEDKLAGMKALGAQYAFVLPFNAQLASMSAEDFIQKILIDKLAASHIVTGDNFRFGKNRAGSCEQLKNQAAFTYSAVSAISEKGEIVSSSLIRQALKEGEVAKANAMLGRTHRISGLVERGESRGKGLGYPTANIALRDKFIPKFGIYVVRVEIDGKTHQGVASIGCNPTFEKVEPRLEIHLLDFVGDLYGKTISCELFAYLREEVAFDSEAALSAQIAKDIEAARVIHHHNKRYLALSFIPMLLVLAFDQLSKWWILSRQMFDTNTVREITSFFNLVLVWNQGISFGMFSDHNAPLLLTAGALIIITVLIVWLAKSENLTTSLAIGMVIGGAVGNIIDRARFGAVADFLDFHLLGYHWPAFNVADSAIFMGVVVLCIQSMFTDAKK